MTASVTSLLAALASKVSRSSERNSDLRSLEQRMAAGQLADDGDKLPERPRVRRLRLVEPDVQAVSLRDERGFDLLDARPPLDWAEL